MKAQERESTKESAVENQKGVPTVGNTTDNTAKLEEDSKRSEIAKQAESQKQSQTQGSQQPATVDGSTLSTLEQLRDKYKDAGEKYVDVVAHIDTAIYKAKNVK